MFPLFWLPEDAIRGARGSQYDGWVRQELIITTPGPVTDLTAIEQTLLADMARFEVLAAAYDPWQATQLAQDMMSEGAPMVELRPTVLNFSEPMKQLQAMVYENRLHSDGNPVLEWMASNVVCHMDTKENIYPRKERPEYKIDGIVAAIMAVNQIIQLQIEEQYGSDSEDINMGDLVL
jgi:phage terminase large subunit-like protein